MNAIRATGRFIVDFIVGDDWKIAVAVVAGLAIIALAVATGMTGVPLAVLAVGVLMLAFVVALVVDVRSAGRRKPGSPVG